MRTPDEVLSELDKWQTLDKQEISYSVHEALTDAIKQRDAARSDALKFDQWNRETNARLRVAKEALQTIGAAYGFPPVDRHLQGIARAALAKIEDEK